MDQAAMYTAAVALNNMGVSLLERKCYRQALETLHDAVRLTRTQQPMTVSTLPKQHIADAYRRQCKPEPSKPEKPLPLRMEVVSDDSDSITCLRATHSHDACIAIRLEGFESTNDVQVDVAVILHNYSVAALCLSLAHPTSNTSSQLLQTCLKSLLQCQKELSTRYANLDMDGDFALVHKVFVVAVISTKSLLQALTNLGTSEFEMQILECHEKLKTLKETLSDLDHAEMGTMAAAAA